MERIYEKSSDIEPEKVVVVHPEVVENESYNDSIISIVGIIGTFISSISFLLSLATIQPILISISFIIGVISLVCAILFDNSKIEQNTRY